MKKLLLGLLFLASNGWGAVAISSQTTSGLQTGSNTPITWSMTMGATDNFIAIGCVGVAGGGNAMPSATVGGQAATSQTSIAGTDGNCAIFTRTSPLTGAQTISVTDAGGGDKSHVMCTAVSFTGVNTSAPVDVSSSSAGTGTPTVTRTTTQANTILFDVVGDLSGNGTMTATGGQTNQGAVQNGIQGASEAASTKAAASAGSQTMSWTTSVGGWCQSMIAIAPSTAVAPTPGLIIFQP